MSEEETVLVKKKKVVKQLTIAEAVAILKPKYKKYHVYDKVFWDEVYSVYKKTKYGDWSSILANSGIPSRTWYDKVNEFYYTLMSPEMAEKGHLGGAAPHRGKETIHHIDAVNGEAVHSVEEVCVEPSGDTGHFEQVNSVLTRCLQLDEADFKCDHHGRLKKRLQEVIDNLNDILKVI